MCIWSCLGNKALWNNRSAWNTESEWFTPWTTDKCLSNLPSIMLTQRNIMKSSSNKHWKKKKQQIHPQIKDYKSTLKVDLIIKEKTFIQTLDLSLIIPEAVFCFGMTISHSINWLIIHNDNSENTFFTFIWKLLRPRKVSNILFFVLLHK